MVATGGRHFESAARLGLPAHVGEVRRRGLEVGNRLRRTIARVGIAAQDRDEVVEVAYPADIESRHEQRLAEVGLGDEQANAGHVASGQGRGDDTGHCMQPPVEPEFAEHADPGRAFGRDLARCGQDRDSNRRVQTGTALGQRTRQQSHGDARARPLGATVLNRGAHPVTRLIDGGVGQAHHGHGGQAG